VVVSADTDAADGMSIGAVVGGVTAVDTATAGVLLLVASLRDVDDDDDEVASVDNEAIAVATLLLLSCSFSVLTIASVLRETAGDRLPLLFFFEITSL